MNWNFRKGGFKYKVDALVEAFKSHKIYQHDILQGSFKNGAEHVIVHDSSGCFDLDFVHISTLLTKCLGHPEQSLVLDLDVPEGASEEEITDALGEVTAGLDEYYRALGGSGLQVERLEVESPELAEVGGGL